jgi:hypothetical protein
MVSALATPTRRIRSWYAGRRAAIASGRFGGAQRCERGHRLVSSCMAGGEGLFIWPRR